MKQFKEQIDKYEGIHEQVRWSFEKLVTTTLPWLQHLDFKKGPTGSGSFGGGGAGADGPYGDQAGDQDVKC